MFELTFQPQPFKPSATCRCDACQGTNSAELESEAACSMCGEQHEVASPELTDIVVDVPATSGVYGKPSSRKNPKQVGVDPADMRRCKTPHTCPVLVNLREVSQVSNVPFEYIGGGSKRKGLIWGKTSKRWLVNNAARITNHTIHFLPRTGDGLANFLANMKAVGLEVEALLTMGSLNCRCMTYYDKLSDHSNGDAYDFGGLRLVGGGKDILVANVNCDPADKKVLHRANACLRLSFARVLDYHDIIPWSTTCGPNPPKRHWNHIHCDTNQGKKLYWFTNRKSIGWRYVRESLGLAVTGGKDQACIAALKAFAGNDAFDSPRKTALALKKLYMREAARP